MSKYPLLENFKGNYSVHDLNPDILKEIQGILGVEMTGICCGNTVSKFAEFKEKNYLEYADRLGESTALSLLESIHPHDISEQLEDIPTKVIADAGCRSGNTANLPVLGLVYANEYIVPGIPLTWGEMTKNFNPRRIPNSKQIVENLIATAKVFGIARAKYGKPVVITSGYRPANLGIGASRSQHIPGKAGDSFPVDRSDTRLWYNILRDTPGVMGLGDATDPRKGGFVHFDIRDTRSQVRFGY